MAAVGQPFVVLLLLWVWLLGTGLVLPPHRRLFMVWLGMCFVTTLLLVICYYGAPHVDREAEHPVEDIEVLIWHAWCFRTLLPPVALACCAMLIVGLVLAFSRHANFPPPGAGSGDGFQLE